MVNAESNVLTWDFSKQESIRTWEENLEWIWISEYTGWGKSGLQS